MLHPDDGSRRQLQFQTCIGWLLACQELEEVPKNILYGGIIDSFVLCALLKAGKVR
jgi:hypothetical protein